MPHREFTLYRSTMLVILVGPIALYWLTSYFFSGRTAIELGNGVLMALSAGVAVTFAPTAWDAFTRGQFVDREDILGTGICIGFAAIFIARVFSIVWRAGGQDPSWLDSSAWGMHIALSTSAALFHSVAPGAIRGRIPTMRLIKIGAWVAAGIGVFSLIVWVL